MGLLDWASRINPFNASAQTVLPADKTRLERVVADTKARLSDPNEKIDIEHPRAKPSTAEKLAATYGSGIAGRIQFLPYLESVMHDTPEIRLAMRQMLKNPYVKAAWLQ